MAGLHDLLAEVRATRVVSTANVLAARRIIYGGLGLIPPDAIATLFAIEEAVEVRDPAWEMLLVEAAVDHLVRESEPEEIIDDVKAAWLVQHLSLDGMVNTAGELEVLIRLLEESRSATEPLSALALEQVRAAVVDGAGPLSGIADADRNRVTREETSLIRRILYAFGGQGGVAITRAEADVLFDINDAAVGADNDPEWTDLFVKAVANCIMTASGYQAPPRPVALAPEDWSGQPDAFAAEVAVAGLRGIIEAYAGPRVEPAKSAKGAATAASGDGPVAENEAALWLAERIGRDGEFRDEEKALLRFIRNQAPQVHPVLMELIAKAT